MHCMTNTAVHARLFVEHTACEWPGLRAGFPSPVPSFPSHPNPMPQVGAWGRSLVKSDLQGSTIEHSTMSGWGGGNSAVSTLIMYI